MKTHQTENTIKIDPFGDMTRFVFGCRHPSSKSRLVDPRFSISAMDHMTSLQLDQVVEAIRQAQKALVPVNPISS
jgi:hypothetical protein